MGSLKPPKQSRAGLRSPLGVRQIEVLYQPIIAPTFAIDWQSENFDYLEYSESSRIERSVNLPACFARNAANVISLSKMSTVYLLY